MIYSGPHPGTVPGSTKSQHEHQEEGFYNAVKLPDLKGDEGVNQQMMV